MVAITNSVGESASVLYRYSGSYLTNLVIVLTNGTEILHNLVRDDSRRELVMERSVLVNGTASLGNHFEYDLLNRLVASTNTFAGTSSYGYNGRSEVTIVDASVTTRNRDSPQ